MRGVTVFLAQQRHRRASEWDLQSVIILLLCWRMTGHLQAACKFTCWSPAEVVGGGSAVRYPWRCPPTVKTRNDSRCIPQLVKHRSGGQEHGTLLHNPTLFGNRYENWQKYKQTLGWPDKMMFMCRSNTHTHTHSVSFFLSLLSPWLLTLTQRSYASVHFM